MPHRIDFTTVSTAGVETSPVADALAGLRANEARYFHNKYKHEFVTEQAGSPAGDAIIAWVAKVLDVERGIVIGAAALEAAEVHVDGIRWAQVFYESGLAVNVLYTLSGDKPKRAVGFKLSEGMEPPSELDAFKWARQKSKLAGEIRGTYFVVKGEY